MRQKKRRVERKRASGKERTRWKEDCRIRTNEKKKNSRSLRPPTWKCITKVVHDTFFFLWNSNLRDFSFQKHWIWFFFLQTQELFWPRCPNLLSFSMIFALQFCQIYHYFLYFLFNWSLSPSFDLLPTRHWESKKKKKSKESQFNVIMQWEYHLNNNKFSVLITFFLLLSGKNALLNTFFHISLKIILKFLD